MNTSVHDPTPDCHDVHCYSHNVDEPAEGAYRCCLECSHVFPTAAALLADVAARVEQLNRELLPDPFGPEVPVPLTAPTDPEQVWHCPHCAHDF